MVHSPSEIRKKELPHRRW